MESYIANKRGVEFTETEAMLVNKSMYRLMRLLPSTIVPHLDIKGVEDKYSENKDNKTYEASVSFSMLGTYIRGEGRSAHSVAAVNEAIDDAVRKYRKFKDRRYEKQGERITSHLEEKDNTETVTMEDFEKYGNSSDRVTIEKEIDIKPLTVDEAIEQMEMAEKDFFVFYDLDGNVRVVYKRKRKSGYGLLKG